MEIYDFNYSSRRIKTKNASSYVKSFWFRSRWKGKEVFDLSLKIGGKTILTPEKFYELRLKDSKLSLDKFLEKLTKKGFVKPDGKPFGSRSALHRLQQELGIADLVGGDSNASRKRSLQDVKAIVRSAPNGPQILKSITDKNELRKIANALVSRDRLEAKKIKCGIIYGEHQTQEIE